MINYSRIENGRVLVTGGAGFIGSNICEDLLKQDNEVICLDNFSTGKIENIINLLNNKKFKLIVGDIRRCEDCSKAVDGTDLVLHQAALGSVPRSIKYPTTTNEVNINGFLNMLVAARDAKIKRFVYAASSSTYGDSKTLPKVENTIGNPLSPYAVTKYTNELYAHVFLLNYGMEIIGLRYFNVFGRRQDPDGAYAAVIPKFTVMLMKYQSPTINGDGTISRDFTYIDNVIQMNHLAAVTRNKEAIGQVFNTAVGEQNDLNTLVNYLKQFLAKYDSKVKDVAVKYGPERQGDISQSLASIEKAKTLLNYHPEYDFSRGLELTIEWFWKHYN